MYVCLYKVKPIPVDNEQIIKPVGAWYRDLQSNTLHIWISIGIYYIKSTYS